jgi:2-desacetyl-2-hydroxyethyl bacteriochlorophyllide A dehydrogenase
MSDASMTMLCGTCIEPGRFELVERPLPVKPADGWVLVDLAAVGLCGTDFHIFEGKHPYLNYPRVIGHELSGHITDDGQGWRKGQLVVVNPYIACGTCHACKREKPNCCISIGVLGVHRDGGMCARIAVPVGNLFDAQGLTPREAALVEFLAIGAHAVRRSDMTAADRVLVTGAGPIGLGAAMFARLTGAEVHLLDLSEERLAAAQRLGFANLLRPGDVMPTDGFDVVMDATGNPRAMEAGFSHVAHGGSYVLVSVVKGEITFNDAEFHKREMRLIGSRNAQAADFANVITALKSGAIPGEALISATLTLAELPKRISELAADRGSIIKAIVMLGGAV